MIHANLIDMEDPERNLMIVVLSFPQEMLNEINVTFACKITITFSKQFTLVWLFSAVLRIP